MDVFTNASISMALLLKSSLSVSLVVHLCNPSDDIVIYWKHVDPKFNLSVFEELLEEVANFIQGKNFGLL